MTALLDHHAHSVARTIGDRVGFERYLTESAHPAPPGCSWFDSFLGAALLRICPPLLDIEPGCSADAYLARRLEVGDEEVARRLLPAAGTSEIFVDHGYRADELIDPQELAHLAGATVRRIVRLETLAEEVARTNGASGFAGAFEERLAAELSGPDAAVGCKSVLAYRHGLDVDPRPPAPAEVAAAAAEWLGAPPAGAGAGTSTRTGSAGDSNKPGTKRLEHPVLLRHLVWCGIRAGVPLQFHTGFGDADLELHRSDPSLLTALIRAAEPAGTPIMLLHCYPYHRQAAHLATVHPHVYFDVGLALHHVGRRAPAVLAEAIESAPFHKMLYSSDAYGLPELHLLAATAFREALEHVLDLLREEGRSEDEVARVAGMIAAGNARRAYQSA